ncbi:MAG: tetratricopeptide repeat protein [Candidatus Omnitrophica bacterium]|nr:tetratricopeptide repeat protein [Candidatus Omnitrophota bacterium]
MDGLSAQKIALIVRDFLFTRIVLFLVISLLFFYLAVNRHVLKLKTLNYYMPDIEDLRMFTKKPSEMDREQLKKILVYYKNTCHFTANDPEEPAPCSIAAYGYYYLGNTRQALNYYQRALKGNQYFFWTYFNMGAIYYNEGNYEQAAQEFKHALELTPEKSLMFLFLTKTYKDLAFTLRLAKEEYIVGLKNGYDHTKELQKLCQLLSRQPELKSQTGLEEIKLRIF